jgi:phosphotransferase system IIB component
MVIRMTYDFQEFVKDNIIWLSITLAVVVLILLIVLIKVIKTVKKHKKPRIKIDENYVAELISLFGGKENIDTIDVDGNKLKVEAKNLELVNLEDIKEKANSGVFVVNNTIKTLFMYDSETLRKELNKYKG